MESDGKSKKVSLITVHKNSDSSRVIHARFVRRLNKFLGEVKFENGSSEFVFIPNPGRMEELLVDGAEVLLVARDGRSGRKTDFDLVGVRAGRVWVSIDSRMPNRFFAQAVDKGILPDFTGFKVAKNELKLATSRFDFLLENERMLMVVEVKSCTLVRNGVAMFPDAPTERGVRHVKELSKLLSRELMDGRLESGKDLGTAIVFVVQREDAVAFMPNYETHPKFGEVLKQAFDSGVKVIAYRTRFEPESVKLVYLDKLPIRF